MTRGNSFAYATHDTARHPGRQGEFWYQRRDEGGISRRASVYDGWGSGSHEMVGPMCLQNGHSAWRRGRASRNESHSPSCVMATLRFTMRWMVHSVPPSDHLKQIVSVVPLPHMTTWRQRTIHQKVNRSVAPVCGWIPGFRPLSRLSLRRPARVAFRRRARWVASAALSLL